MAQPKITNGQLEFLENDGDPYTGALQLPVGTTAERPTPATGMIRFNSDEGHVSMYDGAGWYFVPTSLHATATLDFPSITGNGGEQSLTVSVPGATTADFAFVTRATAGDSGVIYRAYVSAADTVTVIANNVTAGAIDPTSDTYFVVVFKHS